MAKKGKTTILSKAARGRLKKLPGSARQYLDPKTGITYSRRQFEKGRVAPARRNISVVSRKFNQYLQIRDSFIEKEAQKGRKIGKRQAMKSEKLKKIIKDLHSKDPYRKKRALMKTMRGDKVKDWTPYIERWKKGEL